MTQEIERVYVLRGPKGRADKFLTGTATQAGEWGSRAAAMRGDREWVDQAAREYGGTPDADGWREKPETLKWTSPRREELARREARERGAADRAARKDGTFFDL